MTNEELQAHMKLYRESTEAYKKHMGIDRIEESQKEILRLKERLESAEEALKFYTNPQNYTNDQKEFFPRNELEGVVYISGEVARRHFQNYQEDKK